MNNISGSSDLPPIREEKARKNLEEALGYFRNDWNNLASLISHYYPLEVLKMAVWEDRRITQTKKNDEEAKAAMRFFPHLIQSIIQSRAFASEKGFSANRDIKQKDWNRIKELGYDAARRISWYLENFAVLAVHEGKVSRENYAAFRSKIFSQFFFVELSDEEESYCRQTLANLFYDDEESAKKYFHTDSGSLISAVRELYDIGVSGIDYLSGESLEIQLQIRSRMEEERAKGSVLNDEELIKKISAEGDLKYRIERFQRRRDGYDLFSVEANTLLSTETCKVLSQNVASYDSSDFTTDGYLSSVYYPFLRFGDRFFSFIGRTLGLTFPVAMKKIMHNGDESFRTVEKLQAACDHILDQFMTGTDIPEVWQWKGHKADVLVMTQTGFLNAFRHPAVFEERCQIREEELASRPRTGHILLLVDPDGFSELKTLRDGVFYISLAALAKVQRSQVFIQEFYEKLFSEPFSAEPVAEVPELEEAFDDDLLPEEEEVRVENLPTEADDDFAVVDESEYDTGDDDEKARQVAEKYEAIPDELPPEPDVHPISKEELSELSSRYELPEEYLKDDEDEGLDEFYGDDDETEAEELPAAEDDLEDEEDESLWDDEEYGAEEEPQEEELEPVSGFFDELDGDEYEEGDTADLAKEDGSEEDPDQLSLFPSDVVEASEEEESDDELDLPEVPSGEETDDEDDIPVETPEEEAEEAAIQPEESEESEEAESAESEIADEEISELESPAPVFELKTETELDRSAESVEENGAEYSFTPASEDSVPVTEEAPAAEAEPVVADEPTSEEKLAVPAFELKEDIEAAQAEGKYPSLVTRIMAALDRKDGKAFYEFADGVEYSVLESFSSAVSDCIDKVHADGRDKLMSIFDFNLSMIIASDRKEDSLRRTELRNNVGAVMYSREATEWTSIVLGFAEDGTLAFTRCEVITPDSFSQSDWKIVHVLGDQLIAKRQGSAQ